MIELLIYDWFSLKSGAPIQFSCWVDTVNRSLNSTEVHFIPSLEQYEEWWSFSTGRVTFPCSTQHNNLKSCSKIDWAKRKYYFFLFFDEIIELSKLGICMHLGSVLYTPFTMIHSLDVYVWTQLTQHVLQTPHGEEGKN